MTAKNHDVDIDSFQRAFGDFIFRPGPGHIELNMAKCLLNFSWPVLLPIVTALGFRTKKAQDVVKRGCDHQELLALPDRKLGSKMISTQIVMYALANVLKFWHVI